MEKRDLVIGAITGYNFGQIAPWVNSLDRSGFTGMKAVIVYNVSYEVCQELTRRGYAVLAFEKDDTTSRYTYPNSKFNIVVERFLHYWLLLDGNQNAQAVRNIIATDVKDVVFQHNPSTYLDTLPSRGKLVASTEGLIYENEAWGIHNLTQSFGPIMAEKHKDNMIVNAGVIAGDFSYFLGLSKTIYLHTQAMAPHVPGGGGPDQAAYNLIMNTPAYHDVTEFTNHDDPWAAQLGTTMDPTKMREYGKFFVGTDAPPLPQFDEPSGLVVTPSGIPYAIVHQWDRVPEVKAAVERMYR